MSIFLARMIAIDTNSLILVVMICGWGFLIMRAMMNPPILALIGYPLMVVNAVAAHVYFADSYFIQSIDRGSSVALTTGIGMIVTVVLMIGIVRVALLIKDVFGRRPELLERGDVVQKTQLR